ncbi:tripartite tricarboxylate transporter substrate binding protein, partial [Burkholderia sola]
MNAHPPTPSSRRQLLLCAAALAATAVVPALAQGTDAFPERELTLIINYGAGGNTDVASRAIGTAMEGLLKKPVV